MGLTVLPQFDPWAKAGEQTGAGIAQGLGKGFDLLFQKKLVEQGVDKAREEFNKPGATPFDALMSLTKGLAGVPGGLQLVQETFPVLREEMIRQEALRQMQPRGALAQPSPQAQAAVSLDSAAPRQLSPDEMYAEEVSKNIQAGLSLDKAQAAAGQKLSLVTAEQQRRQSQESYNLDRFQELKSQRFAQGLSAPVEQLGLKMYNDMISSGKSAQQAFDQAFPKMRQLQMQDEAISNLASRPYKWFSVPEKQYENIRQQAGDLIAADPAYVAGRLQKELGLGQAESHRAVRGGGNQFKAFEKKLENLPRYYTGAIGEKFSEKENRLLESEIEKFFSKGFNPNTDSVLALRATAFDKGMPESKFLEIANRSLGKRENLPQFTLEEMQQLAFPIVPGLNEILSDWWGLNFGKSIQNLEKIMESGFGAKR